MYTNITISLLKTELEKQDYHFTLIGVKLVLQNYYLLRRESTRHSYKVLASYNRLDKRSSSMSLQDVPLSEYIKSEAKKKLMDSIIVVTDLK